MNDQNTFDDLDRRAAAAATDLRELTTARPRPAFDPERPAALDPVGSGASAGSNRSRTLLAVAAVFLLLVAGLGIWAATRPDPDRPDPVGTDTTGGIRGWEATDLPKGMELAGAGDVGPGSDPSSGPRMEAVLGVYGPEPDQPTVGVAWMDGFDPAEASKDATTKLERLDGAAPGGGPAYAVDDGSFGRRAVIVPRGSGAVVVLSPTLERDDLLDLVPHVSVRDDRAVLDTEATSLRLSLLEQESLYALISAVASGSIHPSRAVAYTRAGSEQYLLVQATAGGEALVALPTLVAPRADAVRRTTVRGKDAIVGELPAGLVFLSWQERPGEVVRIVGSGVDQQELLTVAAGLRPMSDAAWDDVVERSKLGDFQPDGYRADDDLIEVARGRLDDGLAWVVRVGRKAGDGATPELQVAMSGDSSSGSSGSGEQTSGPSSPPPAMRGMTELDQGGRRFAAGFVGPEVDRVELRALDGRVLATVEVVAGSGDGAAYRVWVAELPEGAAWAVGLRADGSEAGRKTIAGGGAPEDTVPDPAGPTTVASGTDSGPGGSGSNSSGGSSGSSGSGGSSSSDSSSGSDGSSFSGSGSAVDSGSSGN